MTVTQLILAIILSSSPQEERATIVGCPSEGQQGAEPAPADVTAPPLPAGASARDLSYYASNDLGVFAPRGWHCFGFQGSDGASLIVTPRPLTWDETRRDFALRGAAVEIVQRDGSTSGRWAVADVVAGYFPDRMAFARRQVAEGLMDSLPAGPSPADTTSRASAGPLFFRTAAGAEGLGTREALGPDEQTVSGAVFLSGGEDPDMLQVNVRLPQAMATLEQAIVGAAMESSRRWSTSAASAPTASDVQAFEQTRLLAPLTSYAADGRAHAGSFAPAVETRAAACVFSEANEEFDCRYERRLKEALTSGWSDWETRQERLVWREGCWQPAAAIADRGSARPATGEHSRS
jgi:hypothetical protein